MKERRTGRRRYSRYWLYFEPCNSITEIEGPARLKSIALLDKPSRREIDVKADWTGFEIPDEFVVGYGIDYAQRNRNLDHIGKVRFTG